MKKTKSLVASITIIISLVLLVGCGAKEDKDTEKNEGTKERAEKTVNFIDDNDSYFIVIDGTKFYAGDKIIDLSNVGYNLKPAEATEEIPANKYMIGAGGMRNSVDEKIFNITPFNTKDDSIKISDAVIGGFDISYAWAKSDERSANIEVYGGLKLGSTEEEVKKVFGEPSSVNEVDSVTGGPTAKYCSYKSSEVYRSYKFTFEEGKVTGIEWQNLVFVK